MKQLIVYEEISSDYTFIKNMQLVIALFMNSMEEIERVFEKFGSRSISDYSHGERAWIDTPEEQPIHYQYASELRVF